MIRTRTTFVVGAGASKSYGLPTAAELKGIATGLNPQREFGQLLIRHATPRISLDQLTAFVTDLRDHPAQSIDVYLENRHYEPMALPIGKALIASLLAQQILNNTERLNRQDDDWLGYVFGRMAEGAATWQAFDEGNANVRFVTFNFDSMIEDRLERDIKRTHPTAPDDEVTRAIDRWVIHVHGRLPPLPVALLLDEPINGFNREWQQWIVEAAPTITVVLEEIDPEKLRDAREAVRSAHILCFLGFAYAPENLQRLDLPQALMAPDGVGRHLYGTALEYADGERARFEQRLNNQIQLGSGHLKCRGVLRELPVFVD
jgi:hypothetical protein